MTEQKDPTAKAGEELERAGKSLQRQQRSGAAVSQPAAEGPVHGEQPPVEQPPVENTDPNAPAEQPADVPLTNEPTETEVDVDPVRAKADELMQSLDVRRRQAQRRGDAEFANGLAEGYYALEEIARYIEAGNTDQAPSSAPPPADS